MAARLNPANGQKPEKLMRDSLIASLYREAGRGVKTKKLTRVTDRLVREAINGNVQAIVAIMDRVDGKPAQSVDLSGSVGLIELAWVVPGLGDQETGKAIAVQQPKALPPPADE